MATLLAQAKQLAPSHIVAIQQRQATISAAHPHYSTAQVQKLALNQVTQGVLGGLRLAQRTANAAGGGITGEVIAPITNASSQGGAPTVVPGGNSSGGGDVSTLGSAQLQGSPDSTTAATSVGLWAGLSTTEKVAIVGGGALAIVLLIKHHKAA